MSARKTGRRGVTKKRAQRATSNVFAMFDQAQIQEFKEALNMIDQNRDGFIDKEDLHDMLASLGKKPNGGLSGGDDERGSRAHQLYHVSDPVWGAVAGNGP